MKSIGFNNHFVLYLHTLITANPHIEELKEEEEVKERDGVRHKFGLPQGWATSPIMAILVIQEAIRKVKWDVVMYADDGLVFSKRKIRFLLMDD